MQTIKDWYLGGMVPAQDDAEFEKKHPRKGGKFAKKGEGGGVPTKSEELKEDIQYAKKWIADAKAGKFTASKELIKRNEKYLDGLVRLNDFIDLHGTEVKDGADYSRRIEFLMQNRQHLEIDSIASVMADARIGKFGNFILYPSAKNGAAANVAAHCESLGLGVKKTAKGNIQVFMKDAPKETVGQKKDDAAKSAEDMIRDGFMKYCKKGNEGDVEKLVSERIEKLKGYTKEELDNEIQWWNREINLFTRLHEARGDKDHLGIEKMGFYKDALTVLRKEKFGEK